MNFAGVKTDLWLFEGEGDIRILRFCVCMNAHTYCEVNVHVRVKG